VRRAGPRPRRRGGPGGAPGRRGGPPREQCRVGRARRARPHRRGRGSRVRLCPYRLPPWPGPVAPARLARLRPGAVVARALPRVSAQPPPVGPRRGRVRRGGRGGPVRPVPTRLRPGRRRRARQRLTGVTLPPGRVTTRAPV